MDDNSIGRRVDSDVAFLVRQIAQANPGLSVNLGVGTQIHHSSRAVQTCWTMQIGHGSVKHAASYAEVLEEETRQKTPGFKLDMAAKLRREADQLEAAAKLQSENQQHTPPSYG